MRHTFLPLLLAAAALARCPAADQPAGAALFDPADAGVLARFQPSGQDRAEIRLVDDGAAKVVEFTCKEGSPWPGIALTPAAGPWDLSAAAGVEAVVANAGPAALQVSLRVDEQGSATAWNSETASIKPGATGTIRVRFGYSWGKPGPQVVAARIGRLTVFAGSPGADCRLRLHALAPFGKAGEKPASGPPPAIVVHRTPSDPQVLTVGAAIDRTRFATEGATIEEPTAERRSLALIAAGAAPAAVTYRPKQALDLRDFDQAVFTVRNTGTAAVRVACRLDGVQAGDRAVAEAELAPGERKEITVSFAAAEVWQGRTAPAVAEKGPFLGAAQESTSSGLLSDAVTSVALALPAPVAGARVELEGVIASVSAPAQVPSWVGSRPPVDGDWVKTFNDDFDGTVLDDAKWQPRLPWVGPIPWELQCYNQDNVTVSQGALRIRCEKRRTHLYNNPDWPARDYTTGAVTTYDRFRQLYGYMEARFKLPKALGLWPAFWTMPDRGPDVERKLRGDTANGGMEFDIFEHPNRFGPFRYNLAAHWDGYGKEHRSLGSSRIYAKPDADGYIVAGLLWEPGKLTWYCNGQPVGSWSDPRVSTVPARLKFTVQMGGWAGNEVDDSALPDDFVIDWARVWQLRERLPVAP